jgi:hypothetical protein
VSSAIRARRSDIDRFGRAVVGKRRHREKLADAFEIIAAVTAGEQAIMADAMKAAWQVVEQEALDKGIGSERLNKQATAPTVLTTIVMSAPPNDHSCVPRHHL